MPNWKKKTKNLRECSNCIFGEKAEDYGKYFPKEFNPFIFEYYCGFYGGLFELQEEGLCPHHLFKHEGYRLIIKNMK